MISKLKRLISLAVTVLVTLTFVASQLTATAQNDKKVVRVGFYLVDGLQEISDGGTYSGYIYDYLQAISRYTGWEYKYVINTFSDCEKMLENGEIDILGCIEKNDSREEKVDFSEQAIGTGGSMLVVDEDNFDVDYADYQSFDGMTVGVIKSAGRNDSFDEYSENNNFTMNKLEYDTPDLAFQELRSGAVDSLLLGRASSVHDCRIIDEFNPVPFYFACSKSSGDIIDELDFAISKIKTYEPEFDIELAKEYFENNRNVEIVLSKQEKEYLQTCSTIKVAYDPYFKPIEYTNDETGEFQGIAADLYSIISKKTGLKFEFVTGDSFQDSVDLFSNGGADIISTLNHNYNWASLKGVSLTQQIVDSPVVAVYSKDGNEEKIIALPIGYYISYVTEEYIDDDWTVLKYDTIEECIQAVSDGRASYTLTNSYVYDYYASDDKYRNITNKTVTGLTEKFCIAISNDADPMLVTIINKAISSMTDDEIKNIISNNIDRTEETSIFNILYDNPIESIVTISVITVAIIILLAFVLVQKRRLKNTMISMKKQTDTLDIVTTAMNAGIMVNGLEFGSEFTYINNSLCELIKYSREELENECHNSLLQLIDSEDAKAADEIQNKSYAHGDECSYEYRISCGDGCEIWIQNAAKKFVDVDGITKSINVLTDITPLKKAMEALRTVAEYDELTGLYNKRSFISKARNMINENPDDKYAISVWNIERFKVINDMFGTSVGDAILCRIADYFRQNLPDDSVYCRLVGDHFAVCCKQSLLNVESMLMRIDSEMSGMQLGYKIIINLGIYIVDDDNVSCSRMCDRAMLALQTIKGSYIKRYVYYNDKMMSSLVRDQSLVNEMNRAIEQKEFDIYLQPQYSHSTGELRGAEALVRWNHPDGMIMPNVFIPVFERNGFITSLDMYVWERACQVLKYLSDIGIKTFPISVNISRLDIYHPELCNMLKNLLAKYKINPKQLCIEITETAYVENPAQLIEVISNLKKMGFVIEMDDFGSGYSSLNMLKDVPVDVLKLDMRFLSGGIDNGRGENILSSVVKMATQLGIPCVAEGVENVEQADFLEQIGCDIMQGYYYSKPIEIEDFYLLVNKSINKK